jgi:hypothetical protein
VRVVQDAVADEFERAGIVTPGFYKRADRLPANVLVRVVEDSVANQFKRAGSVTPGSCELAHC